MYKAISFLLLVFTILLSGCAVSKKAIVVEPQKIYNNYKKVEHKPKEIQSLYVNYYVDEQRNQVLNLMQMGLYAYQKGYFDDATFAFDKSLLHIESLYGETELSEKAKSLWHSESEKFFIGEPYERAMAYYYRGMLYINDNDLENARASFKGGLLQDSRAENQQFQADYLSLVLLEALTSKANGDDELYHSSMNELATLKSYVMINEPIMLDTNSSISIEGGNANTTSVEQGNSNKKYPHKSRKGCIQRGGVVGWNAAINQVSCQIGGQITYFEEKTSIEEVEVVMPKSPTKYKNISIKEVVDNSNVFIFIDAGKGPEKFTTGKNDSALSFRDRSPYMIPPKVRVNNQMKEAILLDKLYYQASTRGGREIDKIIGGKATYKDETKETGEALQTAGAAGLYASATAAMASDNEYVQAAAGVVALVSLVAVTAGAVTEATSDAMIATADARYWDNLPGRIYVYMDKLPVGKHTINVQSETLQTIEVNVPENNIVIKHVMPNIKKPTIILTEEEIINTINEKDKYEAEYQKSLGEDNNETMANQFNNFINNLNL